MEWQDYPGPGAPGEHTVAGTIRVLPGLQSPQLENTRDLLVHLPRSYAEGERRYPVLYMHDGQNLFDRATAFGDEWRVDEAMEAAAAEGIEAIVVGVPNAGAERCDEYSPFVDSKQGGGGGDLYVSFLIDTVKPLIDDAFRTLPDPDSTIMVGSSMGGLITLYAGFRRPEVFGRIGVMSPSIWFAQRAILPAVEAAPAGPSRIYLDVGTREGEATLADARRLRDLLRARRYQPDTTLRYLEDEGAGHDEGAWGRRFGDALRFLVA